MPRSFAALILCLVFLAPGIAACDGGGDGQAHVVVYTSVDQPYAEPVLDAFEEESGIEVLPVFDVEATKTTGLFNRLLAEKESPQADVWWNLEFAQTLELAEEEVFEPYVSPSAEALPDNLKDSDGLWTAFGGRARTFIVNTDELSPDEYPSSIFDLIESPVDPDRIGLAYPLFGTTATHAAALYALWGPEEAHEYYQAVHDRGIRIVDGNSVVRDLVAAGDLVFGMTDTDDGCGALERGSPVALVIPDQEAGEIGTLVTPNTVALVAGGPNPDEGRALVDYLLSVDVEAMLVEAGFFQVAQRAVEAQSDCLDVSDVHTIDVSLSDIAANIEQAKTELGEIFVR